MGILGLVLASLPALIWAEEPKVESAPAAKAPADKKGEEKKDVYLRVVRDDKGEPSALQTSIVRYVPTDASKTGLIVDLVGAVHVGDKSYYDELNETFEQYEALLFELVAPEGTKIPKGGARQGGANPVSGLQRGMQTMLDLEFQLDCVDYTKSNFVHADMSPDEFSKSMKDKKESMITMIFKMMGQGAALQAKDPNRTSDAEMLMALFAKDRSFRLKRAMATQFENLDGQMAVFEGKEGSTIITERNKKALEVLKREIDGGKKKLGIFYGAGHLSDMNKRLVADFGLKKESERWITAWSLEKPAKKKPEAEKKPEPKAEKAE